jgi:hypothetical protein
MKKSSPFLLFFRIIIQSDKAGLMCQEKISKRKRKDVTAMITTAIFRQTDKVESALIYGTITAFTGFFELNA